MCESFYIPRIVFLILRQRSCRLGQVHSMLVKHAHAARLIKNHPPQKKQKQEQNHPDTLSAVSCEPAHFALNTLGSVLPL